MLTPEQKAAVTTLIAPLEEGQRRELTEQLGELAMPEDVDDDESPDAFAVREFIHDLWSEIVDAQREVA